MDVIALWDALGVWAKVGVVAQAATCGVLLAALHKPTRGLAGLALFGALVGFTGLSLYGIGSAEYTICDALDPPRWCSDVSVGR